MKRYVTYLFVGILWLPGGSPAVAQADWLGPGTKLAEHPRILLLRGQEAALRQRLGADQTWATLNQALLTECDALLNVAPVERIKIGRRLLDKSRETLRRVFFLAYAWRMTHAEKYRQRAEQELLAVSAFSDWNPSHFLDVAEMTIAVAIGYDWLYNDLPETSRTIIRQAILKKGLAPSMDPKSNGWLQNTNNWNQVCNAGMAYGAMAIYEEQPELARTVINRAIKTVVVPMGEYGPDGAYPEGYSYWGYGTTFNVLLISALETLVGLDFGLANRPGFLQTAGYLENMTGPSGHAFNYADAGLNGELQPAMFWFARKLHDPSLLWVERSRLLKGEPGQHLKNRLLPAVLLWNGGMPLRAIHEPKATMWVGAGKNPVALMRSSWSDPTAVYVGFKGGCPGLSHAHMDVGSFIMEADGVRWAGDFGMQEYESLESKHVDLWNMKQDSQRWRVFRYNNYVHNTLTINDSLQRVDGSAAITGWSDTPRFMNATADLTALYGGSMANVRRGVALVDKAYVVVRDELETGFLQTGPLQTGSLTQAGETTVRWTMLTPATVRFLGNNKAQLTKDGKTLTLQVKEPAQIEWQTWPTDPPNDYDAPNPGTTRVGFTVKLPAHTRTAITVLLIPAGAAGKVNPAVQPLAQWPH